MFDMNSKTLSSSQKPGKVVKFHKFCGRSIKLSESFTVASKIEHNFEPSGFVFSDRAISLGEVVLLRACGKISSKFLEPLKIGITIRDPSTLRTEKLDRQVIQYMNRSVGSSDHQDGVQKVGFDLCGISMQVLIRKYFDGTSLLAAARSLAIVIESLEDKASQKRLKEVGECVNKFHWLADSFLNVGHYAEIEDKYRLFYAFVCCLQAKFLFKQKDYLSALRSCDNGLLKGNDLENGWLAKFASFLCLRKLPPVEALHIEAKVGLESNHLLKGLEIPNWRSIPVLVLPSMCSFREEFYIKDRPLIIRGMVNEWPAFRKWSFSYLNQSCGHRTVPVELGKKYTDEDWLQKLMSFHDYLVQYVFPYQKPSKTGYLAQHRLPDQIPELLDDIIIPDYCAFGENGMNEESQTINMFIGPEGTVSPLHIDPKHNFFCQVRGRKFVRLISPRYQSCLYMFDDLMRRNTSQVDVENPDLKQYPKFSRVQCEDFLMEPGDCLFIPKGYFHHIRSLERSISVSIWFGD